mmetsp:Transcript_51956/g.111126  ORF Transcript_51956/g.111126 Transcript_51956/m.111126 type:complete len:261 (+) Transcript_51956:564-1346(+)
MADLSAELVGHDAVFYASGGVVHGLHTAPIEAVIAGARERVVIKLPHREKAEARLMALHSVDHFAQQGLRPFGEDGGALLLVDEVHAPKPARTSVIARVVQKRISLCDEKALRAPCRLRRNGVQCGRRRSPRDELHLCCHTPVLVPDVLKPPDLVHERAYDKEGRGEVLRLPLGRPEERAVQEDAKVIVHEAMGTHGAPRSVIALGVVPGHQRQAHRSEGNGLAAALAIEARSGPADLARNRHADQCGEVTKKHSRLWRL